MDEIQYNQIMSRFDKLDEKVDKTNGRVRALENWRYLLMGMGLILTVLIIPIVIILIGQR